MCDNNGQTPLHRACLKGSLKSVELLLQQEQQGGVDMRDLLGNTPLHYACEKEHLGIIRMLVQNGASLQVVNNEGQRCVKMCSKLIGIEISKFVITFLPSLFGIFPYFSY
jgi:ankyrin repeat protein